MRLTFDVVCPFAYIASVRLGAIAARAGVPLGWRPILLGGLLKAHGGAADPNVGMPDAKRRLVRADMRRQAALAGVPLVVPAAHPRRTVDAMRLVVSAPERTAEVAARLFRAYWVDGDDVSDRATLRRIGAELGLSDVDARIDDPSTKAALRASTDAAAAEGVVGVPTVEVGGLRVWGADRLAVVEEALGLPATVPSVEVQAPSGPSPVITLFHDVASPFSYLAWTQRARLAERAGARIEAVPVLVGAVFRAIGTPDVPLHTFGAAKAAWVGEDLRAWASRYGVPFRYASRFPIRSLLAGRVIVAEPAAADALYRAAWAEDRDVSTPEGVRAVLDGAGFDGGALLARADDPAVKDQLRANTDRALAAGACGVPTFAVGGSLFWGQDRMDMVALAARGWAAPDGG